MSNFEATPSKRKTYNVSTFVLIGMIGVIASMLYYLLSAIIRDNQDRVNLRNSATAFCQKHGYSSFSNVEGLEGGPWNIVCFNGNTQQYQIFPVSSNGTNWAEIEHQLAK